MTSAQTSTLKISDKDYIAYHKINGKENYPGVIFLGGLMSDMEGTKARALEEFCIKNEYPFIRFDYIGHGQSSGKFTDGTISIWKNNTLAIIDQLTSGSQILVGSSLGGWLMLLCALERSEKIVGLLGVASAPDFTEELIWKQLDEKAQQELMVDGLHNMLSDYNDDPYPITKELIEDGRRNLLLGDKIDINCPVRLLHGMLDDDVPHHFSVRLSELLTTDNMCVSLSPEGDHRMSDAKNLAILTDMLKDMVDKYTESV